MYNFYRKVTQMYNNNNNNNNNNNRDTIKQKSLKTPLLDNTGDSHKDMCPVKARLSDKEAADLRESMKRFSNATPSN